MLKLLKSTTAFAAAAALLGQSTIANAQQVSVTGQPVTAGQEYANYYIEPTTNPNLSLAQMTALIRQKVKYVFVIYNENHSFDNEYGSFPGVNGLYSDGQNPRSAANTPGFTQTYTDMNGATQTVTPFLIGPQQNSTFVDSVDHSHTGLAKKIHVVNGVPQMDQFALDEYSSKAGASPTTATHKKGLQFSKLVMSHIDCNTIPFFWRWARNFTIFDNIFATEDTPSTPNAVAIIAGQSGETQWVKHPTAANFTGTISGTIAGTTYSGTATTQGVPLVNDPQPWWGSEFDATTGAGRQPFGPNESYASNNIATNLTFATIALTAMGNTITATTAKDANASFDLADLSQDIPYIQKLNRSPVAWRWYQEGYNLESTDTGGVASHNAFVSHHAGAQYFGYISNNPAVAANLKGETDVFTDLAGNNLPTTGGVFILRGGYLNQQGLTPPIQNANYPDTAGLTPAEIATINKAKSGDDDHPSYSDRQISEAMAARLINSVAGNPALWAQSAIIITYDESDGFYDHVPPKVLSYGPDGLPLSRGVRVPLILISPYARSHATSHAMGDHNAVIETVNAIFNLPALSSLPDEAQALTAGNSATFNQYGPAGFQQTYLGPHDTNSPITDSLLSGFDPKRLTGAAAPLPASLATIPANVVTSLPHYAGNGCSAIGMTPLSDTNPVPAGFNTLPSTLPAYN